MLWFVGVDVMFDGMLGPDFLCARACVLLTSSQ